MNEIAEEVRPEVKAPDVQDELHQMLTEVMYKFVGRISVSSALGVLRIVENDIIKAQGL